MAWNAYDGPVGQMALEHTMQSGTAGNMLQHMPQIGYEAVSP